MQAEEEQTLDSFHECGIQSQARVKTYSPAGKVSSQRDMRPQAGLFPGRQSENQLQLCDKGTPASRLVARHRVWRTVPPLSC